MASIRNILILLTALFTFAPLAQARSWGFDVDTVYSLSMTAPPNTRRDSVFVVNNGVDTLRLDSMFVEDVDNHWTSFSFSHGRAPGNIQYDLARNGGGKKFLGNAVVAPGSGIKLSEFALSGDQSRTLIVRLRFKSTGGENDSVVVKGRDLILSIHPYGPRSIFPPVAERIYDIRGRKIEPSENIPALLRKPKD
jgi:hypothetical protein